MATNAKEIRIHTEYITLGQLLKFAGIISLGSEEKIFLAENKVLVNGEPENRRGKKLRPGDRVEIGAETLEIRAQ